MDFFTIDFLQTALDILGFALCASAVLVVVKHKAARGRNAAIEGGKGVHTTQSDAALQWLKQCESAFASVSDTLAQERERLQKLINQKETAKSEASPHRGIGARGQTSEHHLKRRQEDGERCDHYAEIERLGDSGLDVKKISEKAKAPKGEVELVLRLKRMETSTRVVA